MANDPLIRAPTSPSDESAFASHQESKPVRIRYLLAAILPSALFATLLVPTKFGTDEYIRSYLFLFAVASITGVIGVKRNTSRYVTAATVLICITPFLPILFMLIADEFQQFFASQK
jgi:hypothetical protein